MTLGYEHLATACLSAMLTTLLITSHAPQHSSGLVVDAPALPTDRCDQPSVTTETADIIRATIEGARLH